MLSLSKIFLGTLKSCRGTVSSMCQPGVRYSMCSGDKSKGGSKGDNKDPCDTCPECRSPSDYNPSTPTMYDVSA